MITLTNFQNKLKEAGIEGAYIDSPQYLSYFTNLTIDPHERIAALITFQDSAYLFVPSIEKENAERNTDLPVITYHDHQNPWKIMQENLLSRLPSPDSFGIDQSALTVKKYFNLKKYLPFKEFVDIAEFIQELTVIKNKHEIEKMKKAGRMADEALSFGIDSLKEGITEQEVAALIDHHMKKAGADAMSFPTMVLFGGHAASPHGVPGERRLQLGEFVLFDLGIEKDGYTSDVTRTIAYGNVSAKAKKIYDVVLDAQMKAQQFVKPGVKASDIDKAARDSISEAGYGEFFTHRLGHGLGITVHEYPSITSENDLIIQEGMCFSIEPGIYIPGKIGIRIEDCVYVTKNGSESFTHFEKEFKQV